MDAHFRRRLALDAVKAVASGARARDVESEIVDFKEERGTFDQVAKRRVPIQPHHDPAAQALAEEAACLSNSDDGGVLVVGVNDKVGGPAAFVGTYLDTTWLRKRIYELTSPSLSVDVIEEIDEAGQRLYVINVPPGLEEVRVGGKLRARHGTDCVELAGDRARELLERRRNFDWTAEPAGMRLSEADQTALGSARHHYQQSSGRTPRSDLELVRRLGVAADDSDNPQLNRAGALLLCRFEPDVDQIQVLVTTIEGAPSRRHAVFHAPLVTAFDEAWRIVDGAFPAEPTVVGAQRRSVRAVPEPALREALVNAIMHRDYRLARGRIVATAIGDPAHTLKVVSPGGFPRGVLQERLLAVRSLPRNPALAHAMRTLGLSEMEGIGVGTMYRVLLRDGHPPPDIVEDAGDVVCRLVGGPVDREVRAFFDQLYAADGVLEEDARAHIVITELFARTPVSGDDLAGPAQCSPREATEILDRLADVGAIERLVNGGRYFRLTHSARHALRDRIRYPVRQPLDESWVMIRAFLDANEVIGQRDVVALLGVQPVRASNILSRLYNDRHVIEPVGRARGRGVRYRLVASAH